ncbi:hypothetical protein DSL92_01420 [Billgrantia gudaonensis]|uniref:Uncharacterized protein n=1 Tax=Billgrantia gudaonensis TaxID=376427 RepID=A0A3S0NXF5_9GAMM|nr:hypothetical protein DSL92_01420 [Halomonas gudaonensis]
MLLSTPEIATFITPAGDLHGQQQVCNACFEHCDQGRADGPGGSRHGFGCPATVLAQDGEVVEIRMQRYTGTEGDEIFQRYQEMLAEASDGRIQLNIFRGGAGAQ